ncbi:MAG: rhomboid family intramembrane serine protease [Dehalococcoidales bacterium]|nr:rhomboid family intramembrane serine protease [Dehalococcoidales bacterium]
MIPVNDSVSTRHTPWVNYGLIIANVLVFLVELSLGAGIDGFIQRWGVTPAAVSSALSGAQAGQQAALLTLITALFLHAGWVHLGGNMLFLWVFGDNVEDRFGHLRYLVFYLLVGVGANLAQVIFMPGSAVPLIGASGAIAGVLGAYIIMYPRSTVTVLIPVFFLPLLLPVPAFLMLGIWFITQFANGLASITPQAQQMAGGVGWWAHIGGFLIGVTLTLLLPKARPSEATCRPLAAQSPRALGKSSPVSAAVVRTVTFLGDAISLLLTLRVIFLALAVARGGILDFLAQLVYALSWPLVEPFTAFVPYLRIGNSVVELYTLLALLVYYALISVLAWALSLVLGRRQSAAY